MENYFSSSFLSTNLFDSLVLNGSDTPFTGHKKWVEKIKFSQDIIITMNKNDSVLLASRVLDYTQLNLADDRLGLGLGIDNYLFYYPNLKIQYCFTLLNFQIYSRRTRALKMQLIV